MNVSTGEARTTQTDAAGNYRFVSLAPGNYKLSAEATGFAKAEADFTLLTAQNLNLPMSLHVGSVRQFGHRGHIGGPDRRHGGQSNRTNHGKHGGRRVANRRSEPGHAYYSRPRCFRVGHEHLRKPRLRHRQFLDGRISRCERERSGSEQQPVHHRRSGRHQVESSKDVVLHQTSRRSRSRFRKPASR